MRRRSRIANYNPLKGLYKLERQVERILRDSGGSMPMEALLNELANKGYHLDSSRRILSKLNFCVVDDGVVKMKRLEKL